MRFVLDQDVSETVRAVIQRAGHECWRVPLPGETPDDDVAIYADDKNATLVSHDREFATRRRRQWFGRHIRLRCSQPHAEEVVSEHIDWIVSELQVEPVVLAVSQAGVSRQSRLWS